MSCPEQSFLEQTTREYQIVSFRRHFGIQRVFVVQWRIARYQGLICSDSCWFVKPGSRASVSLPISAGRPRPFESLAGGGEELLSGSSMSSPAFSQQQRSEKNNWGTDLTPACSASGGTCLINNQSDLSGRHFSSICVGGGRCSQLTWQRCLHRSSYSHSARWFKDGYSFQNERQCCTELVYLFLNQSVMFSYLEWICHIEFFTSAWKLLAKLQTNHNSN